MTVNQIGALAPELKRASDAQSRAQNPTPAPAKTQGTASLPTDTLSSNLSAIATGELINLQPVILQVEAQNRDAAASSLSDADLQVLIQAKVSPQEALQNQAKQSIAAQTNKLPNNLLALLGE